MAPRKAAGTDAAPPADAQAPEVGPAEPSLADALKASLERHGPNAMPSANGASAFDWGTLDSPVAMPDKKVGTDIKANVLETVPEPIRQRCEASLAINTARVAAKPAKEGKRPRVNYHWDVQPLPNQKIADDFIKAITKYAKYRPLLADIPFASPDVARGQVTARCGEPSWFVKDGDGTPEASEQGKDGAFYGVRYSVRPFEQRSSAARLPGTA